jgi:DNA uptake protein ComE-like DNA-binding protein
MNSVRLAVLLISSALLFACGPLQEPGAPDEQLATSSFGLTISELEASRVLALVNYPGTDAAALDGRAGLERRAAQNIVAKRDGADGRPLTSDDHPFASIAELDAVPYVGDAALSALVAYARGFPAPAGEVVEGVAFAGWQVEAVVWAANTLPFASLDAVLDARAVTGLIGARPFGQVAQIGAVALVGPTALVQLRGQASAWWPTMHNPTAGLAGTFDGVAFDEPTAVKALELANTASRAQLLTGGISSNPAAAIIAGRPLVSVAAVAQLAGVGPATLESLKLLAQASAVDPVEALKARLAPLTADLWFPSETDARMLFVSSAGIGNAPITEALVRARLGAQHDALLPQVMYVDPSELALAGRTQVEELDAVGYLNHIINAADPNDPDSLARAQRIAQIRDELSSQLTDLKIFRFGRISISTFILGRTRTGDLAGLLTGQVET